MKLLITVLAAGLLASSEAFTGSAVHGRHAHPPPPPPPPPTPLKATLISVTDESVTFSVTGSRTLDGSPVRSIKVNYYAGSHQHRLFASNSHEELAEAHSNSFTQLVTIKQLEAGDRYQFSFQAVNAKGKDGPDSADYAVYLLPGTPNVEVQHVLVDKIIVKWGEEAKGYEDFYLVSYEKADNPGCNVTLSVATCFGHQYSFSDLERGATYRFSIRSHNPSGYSDAAIIDYPVG